LTVGSQLGERGREGGREGGRGRESWAAKEKEVGGLLWPSRPGKKERSAGLFERKRKEERFEVSFRTL
jgi:hypothetical protein